MQTLPPTKATWEDRVYSCTYQLTVGILLLSVKESPDVPQARSYFSSLRQRLAPTKPLTGLAGLGLPGYETATGTVVFLKDSSVLQVNATSLPQLIGPHHTSRAELAYTVATDVLACWTE